MDLYNIQNTIFNYIIFISYFLYFLIALGVSSTAPQYLENIQYWVKIYVSLFLIYRFNFLRKIQFTELDRKVAFSAGLFLFTTTIFNQILDAYLKKISHKYTQKNMFNFY
jgi:hypothetical protein